MKTFRQYLDESFVNILAHDRGEKQKVATEVFGMLQNAYSSVGGIHGTGFASPEDMINNIPMWKIQRRNGKIQAVAMYKDGPNGRKRVAVATDGTPQGKEALGNIMKHDLKQERSHGEQSGRSLAFQRKMNPDFAKYAIDPEQVRKMLPHDEFMAADPNNEEVKANPDIAKFFYQRKINGHWHHKVMFGTPGKKIV